MTKILTLRPMFLNQGMTEVIDSLTSYWKSLSSLYICGTQHTWKGWKSWDSLACRRMRWNDNVSKYLQGGCKKKESGFVPYMCAHEYMSSICSGYVTRLVFFGSKEEGYKGGFYEKMPESFPHIWHSQFCQSMADYWSVKLQDNKANNVFIISALDFIENKILQKKWDAL